MTVRTRWVETFEHGTRNVMIGDKRGNKRANLFSPLKKKNGQADPSFGPPPHTPQPPYIRYPLAEAYSIWRRAKDQLRSTIMLQSFLYLATQMLENPTFIQMQLTRCRHLWGANQLIWTTLDTTNAEGFWKKMYPDPAVYEVQSACRIY